MRMDESLYHAHDTGCKPGDGLVFRDGQLLLQRVLPEKRPARVASARCRAADRLRDPIPLLDGPNYGHLPPCLLRLCRLREGSAPFSHAICAIDRFQDRSSSSS